MTKRTKKTTTTSGLSRAAYARHRGCSPKQIRRALALGWIRLERDGSLNAVKADRAWAAAVDPAHPRGSATGRPARYLAARLASQITTTELRRMKLKEEKGALVSRRDATEAIQMLVHRARSSWEAWPAWVAPLIAADLKIDPALFREVLDSYVKQHLAKLPLPIVELR